MPTTASAIKKAKQDVVRTSRNRRLKEKMHDSIKDVEKTAKTGGDTKALLSAAYKKIDKAAKQNLLAPATAARRKARVAKLAKVAASK